MLAESAFSELLKAFSLRTFVRKMCGLTQLPNVVSSFQQFAESKTLFLVIVRHAIH